MKKEHLAGALQAAGKHFHNTIECLSEADSTFAPREGTYSAAQQVAHAGRTIDWLMQGAFGPQGFDMDFEKADREVKKVHSLKQAIEIFDRAIAAAADKIHSSSEEELAKPIAPGPIMGGQPRNVIVGAIVDHTAHHRGSLAVYARLLNKVPKIPYSE